MPDPIRGAMTPESFNLRGEGHLPGLLGLQILEVGKGKVESRLEFRKALFAPNGFLHADGALAKAGCMSGRASHRLNHPACQRQSLHGSMPSRIQR